MQTVPSSSRSTIRCLSSALIALTLLAIALAAPALAAAADPTVLTIDTAGGVKIWPYNAQAEFHGTLTDGLLNPVDGYTVQFQRSLDNATWNTVADVLAEAGPYSYQYSARYDFSAAAWFRFSFRGKPPVGRVSQPGGPGQMARIAEHAERPQGRAAPHRLHLIRLPQAEACQRRQVRDDQVLPQGLERLVVAEEDRASHRFQLPDLHQVQGALLPADRREVEADRGVLRDDEVRDDQIRREDRGGEVDHWAPGEATRRPQAAVTAPRPSPPTRGTGPRSVRRTPPARRGCRAPRCGRRPPPGSRRRSARCSDGAPR